MQKEKETLLSEKEVHTNEISDLRHKLEEINFIKEELARTLDEERSDQATLLD